MGSPSFFHVFYSLWKEHWHDNNIVDQHTFLDKALSMIPNFAPGDPLDEARVMGAIADPIQMKTVLGSINSGKEEGARLLAGGTAAAENDLDSGRVGEDSGTRAGEPRCLRGTIRACNTSQYSLRHRRRSA
jgi:hypothetical protein